MKRNLFPLLLVFGFFACKEEEHAKLPFRDFNFKKAESFYNKNNDSAFYYFNQLAINADDSLESAKAYTYMATIQSDAGDYFGSIESSLSALRVLNDIRQDDVSWILSNYNELGLNNISLKNYDETLKYFDLALTYSKDERYRFILFNNKALAYIGSENYTTAIQLYNEVGSKNNGSDLDYARTLTNLAITKWLQDSSYNAEPELLKALRIREKRKDVSGMNSSYAHLSDYYIKNRPNLSLLYTHKRLSIAKQLKNANDQIEALQKLIELSPPDSTKYYFEIYQQLNDSIQLARSAAKNQFALIRYEVEKNKADNLKLQKDNIEKTYQINRQRIVTIFIILLTIIFVVSAVFWYKKRKQRLALETQNVIRESQLRTSKKVHDVVANGIYRVMTEIENQPDINKESVLDRLENMYDISRNISYETGESQIKHQPFNEKITGILTSFAAESIKVIIAGNEPDLWQNVSEQAKYEIEHILQELMVNMKKHSQASHVVIRFGQEDKVVHIYYTDNGIGMPKNFQYNNGLKNTGNRIKSINGEIIFDTEVEKGVKIHLSFPVS